MTPHDFYRAYLFWTKRYPEKEADEALRNFHQGGGSKDSPKNFSWIKVSREALLFSTNHLAEKMNMTSAAVCGFEKSEMKGTITLEKMRRVAEAMDCEFVYAIRPKQRILFSHVIWKQLLKESLNHWWVRSRSPNRKAQALAWIAQLNFDSPQFREKKGWARRRLRPKTFSKSDLDTEEFD